MKASLQDLAEALDLANESEWEGIYSTIEIEAPRTAWSDLINGGRRFSKWLGFRFEGGPPGIPLPSPDEALQRLATPANWRAADAYALVFASPPIPVDVLAGWEPEHVVALLMNSAGAALSEQRHWLGWWLTSRTGLAAIALGCPDLAWRMLDAASQHGERHGFLDALANFEPLRSHPDLATNAWVRLSVWRLWPKFEVPLLTALPKPASDGSYPDDVMTRLHEVGATTVAGLVQGTVDSILRQSSERFVNEPLVLALERLAADGEVAPLPEIDSLPDWFAEWARLQGTKGAYRVAHLAGRLLLRHGAADPTFIAVLLRAAARADDLPAIREGFAEHAIVQEGYDQLISAAADLRPNVADALVAAFDPKHVDGDWGREELIQNADEFCAAMVAHPTFHSMAAGVRAAADGRRGFERDEKARDAYSSLLASVQGVTRNLGETTRLTRERVEGGAVQVVVPSLSEHLLHRISESRRSPLDELVLAVALLTALRNTEFEGHWTPLFEFLAAKAIAPLESPRLMAWRIQLLDPLIDRRPPGLHLDEMYLMRGNAHRVASQREPMAAMRALADWESAALEAEKAGHPELLIDAVSWIARAIAQDPQSSDEALNNALVRLDRAGQLVRRERDHATVHQSRAHLLRRTDHTRAAEAFACARTFVAKDSKLHAELAAEEIASLHAVERDAEALALGEAALAAAMALGPCTELAMIQQATGMALIRGGRAREGMQLVRLALDEFRGQDDHNEAVIRLTLASAPVGLLPGVESAEHLQWLRDRREQLSQSLRRDLAGVELEVAKRARDPGAQRRAIVEGLATTAAPRDRLRMRLELARHDLTQGEPVPDLATTIFDAIEAPADDWLRELVRDVLCNQEHGLGGLHVEPIVGWFERQGLPSAAGRFLVRCGDRDRASQHLRRALSEQLTDWERGCCEHQLLTLLRDGEKPERRRLVDGLETWAYSLGAGGQPVKNDLAAAILQDAGERDVEALRRAWRLVSDVTWRAHDPRVERHGVTTACKVGLAIAKAHLGRPTAGWSDVAGFLLSPQIASLSEHRELQHYVLMCLLAAGPFSAEDALERVRAFVGSDDPVAAEHSELVERLEWIEACQAGNTIARAPAGAGGPLDDAPAWLVQLFHERPAEVPLGALTEIGESVYWLLQLRPDRADAFSAALVRTAAALGDQFPDELVSLIGDAIQHSSPPAPGGSTWPKLEAAVLETAPLARAMLAHLDRGRHPHDRGSLLSEGLPDADDLESRRRHVIEESLRAEGLKDRVQADPARPTALEEIRESRRILEAVVHDARTLGMTELVGFEISLANSWKQEPESDIERALSLYEGAEPRLPPGDAHAARLYKVWGDALAQRGKPEDLRKALALLDRSIELRAGTHKVESLLSAAQVAAKADHLEPDQRLALAAVYCLRAFRESARHAEGAVGWCVSVIRQLEDLAPADPRPGSYLAQVAQIYPARASELRPGQGGLRDGLANQLSSVLKDPVGRLFMDYAARLAPAEMHDAGGESILAGIPDSLRQAARAHMAMRSLVGKPDAIEAELSQLEQSISRGGPALPGALGARALCIAALVRHGRRAVLEARNAMQLAIAALPGEPPLPPSIQAIVLSALAAAWSPGDHHDDPVQDFALAARLLERALELEGGEESGSVDTLTRLARARRYAEPTSGARDLREAERLYRRAAERALAEGSYDMAAQGLHNAADALSERADGVRVDRLLAGEKLIREAVAVVRSPGLKALFTSNLAWQLEQLAEISPPPAAVEFRQAAMRAFESVNLDDLGEEHTWPFRLHRTICQVAMLSGPRRRQDEIAEWRKFIASVPKAKRHFLATAQHNLADVLVHDSASPREFFEGLGMLSDCAKLRTLDANPRHHFETAISAAEAILRAPWQGWLGPGSEVPYSPREIDALLRSWLERATIAGRALGCGEELARAGFAALFAARFETVPAALLSRAEEAWLVVQEAMPYLMTKARSGEHEATLALETALLLAERLRSTHPSTRSAGDRKRLVGDDAASVIQWLARAGYAQQRALRARLSRPRSVSHELWAKWLVALDEGPVTLVNTLSQIHAAAPDFLRAGQDADSIWTNLEGRPGAVCVAGYADRRSSVVAVLHSDSAGNRIHEVIIGRGLPQNELQLDEWLREHVARPALASLASTPKVVLWVPGPTFRTVSPNAIWGAVPVAVSLSLAAPLALRRPNRPRSTLIMMADPGTAATTQEPELGAHGMSAYQRICSAAEPHGPIRQVASAGPRFGKRLLGASPSVRDAPASPADLVFEAPEHDVIVIIAHGRCDDLGAASLTCIDAQGALSPLDVAELSRDGSRFTGAYVVLLSCESGRVDASLAAPTGLAGVLVAAGASCVIAPLEPISVETAGLIGAQVVDGLCRGLAPWEVLATLQRSTVGLDGPTLGGPPQSAAQRAAAREQQRRAFVSWVG